MEKTYNKNSLWFISASVCFNYGLDDNVNKDKISDAVLIWGDDMLNSVLKLMFVYSILT